MKLAVLLLLMVGCLAWALHGMDLAAMLSAVGTFRWEALIPVFALYGGSHAMRVLRLRLLLGRPIRFWPLWNIVSVGFLAIHTVPLRMGEFVRPYLLQEKEQVPFGTGLAAVFLERMLDVAMLVGLLLTVGLTLDTPPLMVEGVDVMAVAQRGGTILLAVGTVAGGALMLAPERILLVTDKLPLGGMVRRFREGLHSLLARPAEALGAFGLSILIWVATVLAVEATMWAFHGLPVGMPEAAAVWAATSAAMTAIPTPGFFGSYEAGCTGAARLLGAEADPARAFAIVLHLSQFAFTIVAGSIALFAEGLSLREVVAQSRAAKA